jgi:hypothetical protein
MDTKSKPKANRAPAFQFYPRQFVGDEQVMAMDLDTIGAHILLMCAAASSPEGYRLPYRSNTDGIPKAYQTDTALHGLRIRLRNPNDCDWERIMGQLLQGSWKISDDGKWIEQDGLRRTLIKQKEFSDSQRDRVNNRWNRNDTEVIPNSIPTAYRNDTDSDTEHHTEKYSSSSSAKNKDLMHSHETDARETLATPLVDSEFDDEPVEDEVEKF